MISSNSDSATILVFDAKFHVEILRGSPNGGVKQGRGRENQPFSTLRPIKNVTTFYTISLTQCSCKRQFKSFISDNTVHKKYKREGYRETDSSTNKHMIPNKKYC